MQTWKIILCFKKMKLFLIKYLRYCCLCTCTALNKHTKIFTNDPYLYKGQTNYEINI